MSLTYQWIIPGAMLLIPSLGFAQIHAPSAADNLPLLSQLSQSSFSHIPLSVDVANSRENTGKTRGDSDQDKTGNKTGLAVQPHTFNTLAQPGLFQQIEAQLAQVNQQIANVDASLEQLRRDHESIHQKMVLRGRVYYRLVQAGLLPLGEGFDGLIEHASSIEQLRRSLRRDTQFAKSLEIKRTSLLSQRQKLEDRQQPLQLKRDVMQTAHAAVMAQQDRNLAYQNAFSHAGSATLGPSANSGSDYTTVYGASSDPDFPRASGEQILIREVKGFEAMMGRLSFPVAGRTQVRIVTRMGAGGPGMELSATAGSQVLAVYPGRVAFADRYSSYGNVVIIDHGDQYYSVYGELGTVMVKVGQSVNARGPVGTVGTGNRSTIGSEETDNATQARLYFELRHKSDTIDPSPWFGI